MTKSEWRIKRQAGMTNPAEPPQESSAAMAPHFGIAFSSFIRHSGFGIRHYSLAN